MFTPYGEKFPVRVNTRGSGFKALSVKIKKYTPLPYGIAVCLACTP